MLTAMYMAALLSATTAAGPEVGADAPAQGRRLAVVAFGRCEERQLVEATRELRKQFARLHGDTVLSEEQTASPGGGRSTTTVEEICRTIEAGRADFLNLKPEKAEQTLRAVLPEIDKLPLGPRRWEAYWNSRVQLARVLHYFGKKPQASELFLEVLRVQEDFVLNKIEFAPSTRELFELTKALMSGLPRFTLQVNSRVQGQSVFINGFLIGKTPLSKRLVSGSYEVVVGDEVHRSFKRSISLHSDVRLEVDPQRESGFRAELGPCFESEDKRAARFLRSVRLAAALDTDEVAAVRLEKSGGETYLAATLIEPNRGRELREGRIKLQEGSPARLDELARFVLTGVRKGDEFDATDASPQAGSIVEQTQDSSPWPEFAAIALASTAVALGGVGLYQHFEQAKLDGEAEALRQSDGSLSYLDKHQYDTLRARAERSRSLRNVLGVGAGVAAVGSGVLLGLALMPADDGKLAVSVGVSGSF